MSAAETAKRLIAKKGKANCPLQRPSGDQIADANRPWSVTDADPLASPQIAIVNAVVIDISSLPANQTQNLAPETTAIAFIAFLDMPDGAEPKLGDILVFGTRRFMILQADFLAPDGNGVLYTLHLKSR